MEDKTINENASTSASRGKPLTEQQLKRMKQNKEKALQLRKARVAQVAKIQDGVCQKNTSMCTRPRDTGAGFFLEDDDPEAVGSAVDDRPITNPPAPLFSEDRPKCEECSKEFIDSFLQKNFDCLICDACRDDTGDHCLISKTDAKKEYLLKDCDFDMREPPLKFILKKNPHKTLGSMKLFLRLQVEKRAFEVHGSEDGLDERREQKEEAQVKRKQKAFDKSIKALRMAVRSSLFRRKERGHEHKYGPESYNKEEDTYEKACTDCGYSLTFEKM